MSGATFAYEGEDAFDDYGDNPDACVPVREGTGFMSVRVTRGVPEIVELIEP